MKKRKRAIPRSTPEMKAAYHDELIGGLELMQEMEAHRALSAKVSPKGPIQKTEWLPKRFPFNAGMN